MYPWEIDLKSMNMSCQEIIWSPKAYTPTGITIIDPGLKKSLFKSKVASLNQDLSKGSVTGYGASTADKEQQNVARWTRPGK